MPKRLRLQSKTYEWEERMDPDELQAWEALRIEIQRKYSGFFAWSMRWAASRIVQTELREGRTELLDLSHQALVLDELEEEARGIVGDYGALLLEGLQLFMGFTLAWLLLQDHTGFYLTPFWLGVGLALTLVFWPVLRYHQYHRRIHPMKERKMIVICFLMVALLLWFWFSSDHPLLKWMFEETILKRPAPAAYLILVLGIVVVGLVAYYRRMNDLTDLRDNYRDRMLAFAPWPLPLRKRMLRELRYMGGKPVKTRLRKIYKAALISGRISPEGFRRETLEPLHRRYCIDMSWQYWACSGFQGVVLSVLVGKGLWLLFDPMAILADYYSVPLTTGALLGALMIGGVLLQGINYSVRLWMYGGDPRFSAVLVRVLGLAGAMPLTAVLSGLSPGGFFVGFVVNPVPNLWYFWGAVILVVLLQYGKFEWWNDEQ